MKRPLIESPEEVAQFVAEARSWEGTRYVANGAIKGSGASCSHLPYAILKAVGHKAPEPRSRVGMLNNQILPAMQKYFGDNPEHFDPIAQGDAQTGDLLLFDAGRKYPLGHLILCLRAMEIIHSYQAKGCHIDSRTNTAQRERFIGAWRPIRHVEE